MEMKQLQAQKFVNGKAIRYMAYPSMMSVKGSCHYYRKRHNVLTYLLNCQTVRKSGGGGGEPKPPLFKSINSDISPSDIYKSIRSHISKHLIYMAWIVTPIDFQYFKIRGGGYNC